MMRFGQWLNDQYDLLERKKAHYSGNDHDGENFPQVAGEYKTIRNLSRPTLQKLAMKRGVDPHEPNNKLTSDILTKEFGSDKVQGYYNRKGEDDVAKAKMRKAAKKSAQPSYEKENK